MKRLLFIPLRVLLPVGLLCCAVLAGFISWKLDSQTLTNEIESQFLDEARLRVTDLQANLEYNFRRGDIGGVNVAVSGMATRNDVLAGFVLDGQNRVVAATGLQMIGGAAATAAADLPTDIRRRQAAQIAQVRASANGVMVLSQDRRVAVAYYPLLVDVNEHALRAVRNGVVVVVLDVQIAKDRAFRAAGRQALDNIVGFGLLAAFAWVFIHLSLSRRVAAIVAATREFAAGQLAARTGIQGGDEVGQVALAFDLMAQRIAEDTLRRKQVETELRASEVRYRSLFENMWEGYAYCRTIFEQDELRDFTYLEVNSAFERLTGLGNVVGRKVSEVIPGIADTNRQIFEVYRRVSLTGKPEKLETYLESLDLWLAITVYSSEREHFVAVFDNITERKRAATLLTESERRLSLATESARIGIWDWDVVTDKLVWDTQMYALYGIRVEDFSGACDAWQEGLHPEDREHVEADIRAAVDSVCGFHGEFRIVWPGGEVRHIEAHALVRRAADGSTAHMIGVNWDITERRRDEEKLRESKHFAERIAENSASIIYIYDLETQRTVYTNRNAAEALGYSSSQIIEMGENLLPKVMHPEDLPRILRHHADFATVADNRIVDLEYRLQDVRGDWHWMWARETVFKRRPDGAVWHVLGTAQDITKRRRLEAQLSQSQKLETVGKLAGGIAHEFNSILTAIIGQGELLLGELPAGSPLIRNATAISRAAERAATLTRQLLAYGRKQTLQPKILDLNSVLISMESTLHHLLGRATDVRILQAFGLNAVKADAGQIEEVVMNLAMNAADAMPQGGKFTIETANVMLGEEYASRSAELPVGEYVMLAVSDTGAGMSEVVKARAFEPFFTTKGVGQGTGLGLSTCYGIIKQSGGYMNIYTEPGRGTTFKIYLPQVESETTVPVQRLASPALPRGTETILLVEDDPDLREMAATLLRQLGYTVLAAANGIEALTLKQRSDTGHIDLLFTDVVMPHMSGKELADRVRALYPHTRTLFTSAYTENTILHQGVLDEGLALLSKPFTPSALAQKLRAVLDQPTQQINRSVL